MQGLGCSSAGVKCCSEPATCRAAPAVPAVPREVGPPPGGPEMVRNQIPVVFFTPKGIPGELPQATSDGLTIKLPGGQQTGREECGAGAVVSFIAGRQAERGGELLFSWVSSQGAEGELWLLGASSWLLIPCRARCTPPKLLAWPKLFLHLLLDALESLISAPPHLTRVSPLTSFLASSHAGEATAEDEEAEYAWLPAEALKVFHVGDGSGAGDGQTVPDPNLASCIAAAERAVVAEQRAIEAAADGEGGRGREGRSVSVFETFWL